VRGLVGPGAPRIDLLGARQHLGHRDLALAQPVEPFPRLLGHGQRQAPGPDELQALVAEAAQVHGVLRVVTVPRHQLRAAHPHLAARAEKALLLRLEGAQEGVSGGAAGDRWCRPPQFLAQGREADARLERLDQHTHLVAILNRVPHVQAVDGGSDERPEDGGALGVVARHARARPWTAPCTIRAMWLLLSLLMTGDIQQFPGGKTLPHEKYIHVVSEADSPAEQVYIKSKDGVYVAAAMRKPKGNGPFPVLVHFHGAPGGRGMEQLVGWARGDFGGPVFERFLQEGYVVVIADYRAANFGTLADPPPADAVTYADDAVAVIEHVRKLPFVDASRIHVYGVSLGGDVTMHLRARTPA